MVGTEGRGPGRKGSGGGIPRVAGTGRKRVKFHNISLYFAIDIGQREENHYGKWREAGVKGTVGGRFRPPAPPPSFQDERGKPARNLLP